MKKRSLGLILLLFFLVLLSGCYLFEEPETPYVPTQSYEEQRISMISDVEGAVVIVQTDNGHGSGIVYRKEAIPETTFFKYYVLTNHHVIEDGGEIIIRYGNEGPRIPVRSYASSAIYDVAVLTIETDEDLQVHLIEPFENPGTNIEIKKGQDVYAIGTPQDINKYNYVTQGIVSLASFPYNGVEDLAIMHDAEVNPGNSGGPLFNLEGEVIGINVAKVTEVSTEDGTIAAEGLNYAISINMAAVVVNGFTESDFTIIERVPRLGVTVRNLVDQRNTDINPIYDATLYPDIETGVVIIDFDLTRNGYKELKIDDVIIKMNDSPVETIEDIQAQLLDAKMGDSHTITVLRKVDGEFVEITVTVVLS
ncbi:MAG: S1C family serine protease [Acholeplasmataceae bacterium]|nr:serine protease [Acholeplasmataceae bacterium]